MPYIDKDARWNITNPDIEGNPVPMINMSEISSAGDIQYAIALIIKNYMKNKGLRYQYCNDVMGALAGAQMEYYRRTVAPYEDKKIEENGDV